MRVTEQFYDSTCVLRRRNINETITRVSTIANSVGSGTAFRIAGSVAKPNRFAAAVSELSRKRAKVGPSDNANEAGNSSVSVVVPTLATTVSAIRFTAKP